MEVLKKGSIEPILVSLRDALENITDLSTVTNLRFDVKDSAGNTEITNQAATYEGMTAICLIDTTAVGLTAGEPYRLYLKFTDGSQAPILGPITFRIEDD
jgi:hypothetical protein